MHVGFTTILPCIIQADVDNSGTIDYGEFIAATLHLNKVEREDHLFAAFQYFDKDGSGYITPDELQKACEEFGMEDVKLEDMIKEVDQDNVIHYLILVFTKRIYELQVSNFFLFIQDGRIDYNEFVAMMQKGNPTGFGKRGLESTFSIAFRDALKIGT